MPSMLVRARTAVLLFLEELVIPEFRCLRRL